MIHPLIALSVDKVAAEVVGGIRDSIKEGQVRKTMILESKINSEHMRKQRNAELTVGLVNNLPALMQASNLIFNGFIELKKESDFARQELVKIESKMLSSTQNFEELKMKYNAELCKFQGHKEAFQILLNRGSGLIESKNLILSDKEDQIREYRRKYLEEKDKETKKEIKEILNQLKEEVNKLANSIEADEKELCARHKEYEGYLGLN